jgi:transcriptional pleiotropic regulator of transition state genes
MKSTGIIRKIDELGRIVLPAEVRKAYNISPGSEIEISTLNDTIILKKYGTSCIFCGSEESLKTFKEKAVCLKCADELK